MTQPDLFDVLVDMLENVHRAADARGSRRARSSDPTTSKAAAASVSAFAGLHVARILLALRDHGPMTVSEISYRTRLAEQRINKRLPEMQRVKPVGLVDVVTGVTRPGSSGRMQRVWRAV